MPSGGRSQDLDGGGRRRDLAGGGKPGDLAGGGSHEDFVGDGSCWDFVGGELFGVSTVVSKPPAFSDDVSSLDLAIKSYFCDDGGVTRVVST